MRSFHVLLAACCVLLAVCHHPFPATSVPCLETTITLPEDSYPCALCYNSHNDKVYCANACNGMNGHSATAGNVTVIDGASNQVITTVRDGSGPSALCYNSRDNKVYCANWGGNVTVIDGASNQVITTVAAESCPCALCCNSRNNKVYCANNGVWAGANMDTIIGDSVTVIDGASNQVIATVAPGSYLLCYNPQNNKVYCANYVSGNVTVIDGASNQVIATQVIGTPAAQYAPSALCYNPQDNRVYCACASFAWPTVNSDSVTAIDGASNSLFSAIAVGIWPRAMTCNPAQNRVYVANSGSSSISVLHDSASGGAE